jgi:hypothetical protein
MNQWIFLIHLLGMVCVGLLILCFSRIKHPVAKGRLGVVDGSLLQVFTSSEATKTIFHNLEISAANQ